MVVEVKNHRGILRGRRQEVFEFAENVWANRIHLEVRREPAIGVLSPENVEVIEPEIGHDFLELALAVYCPNNLLRLKLHQDLLGPIKRQPHL